jgi:iron complex outermembrane receptor protein
MGGEITVDIHPHPFDWLHFENSFSYVEAVQKNQPDSSKYLPFTPAPKLQSELRADIKKTGKIITNAYLKVELENYFEQNNYYASYQTETKTPGYTLLNVGLGTDISWKEIKFCSFYLNINNITNVAYQSHLSRLKYADINYNTGRTGIFNMGRNVSFKLVIPLTFKKQAA